MLTAGGSRPNSFIRAGSAGILRTDAARASESARESAALRSARVSMGEVSTHPSAWRSRATGAPPAALVTRMEVTAAPEKP